MPARSTSIWRGLYVMPSTKSHRVSPASKRGSATTCSRKSMLVGLPSTLVRASVCFMYPIASSRLSPCTSTLAIIGS